MIRILHVLGGLNRGGAETMIMNIYRKVDREQIQFDFIIHTDEHQDYTDEILLMGGKIYSFPRFTFKNLTKIKKNWDTFFKNHLEYKIIHSHIRSYASVFLPIARKNGVKSIVHSHNTSNGKGIKSLVKMYLQLSIRKKADYFFGCSIDSGRWLFGDKIVESDRFFVINNAIDLSKFDYDEDCVDKLKKQFGFSTNDIILIHVGRFHPQKNHEFLIDIFNDLHKKDYRYKLLLVGDGDLRREIENKVLAYKLKDYVILAGIREDVNQLLMMSDCFIFPSKWEGLPVTVIEAQAAGLKCLIADNITEEVRVSNLITYLPINNGTQLWVDKVLNMSYEKIDVRKDIISSGFDVNSTAKWLVDFYKKII